MLVFCVYIGCIDHTYYFWISICDLLSPFPHLISPVAQMTGVVPESPVNFIRAIVNFDRRRQWESAFEDGVIVEVRCSNVLTYN